MIGRFIKSNYSFSVKALGNGAYLRYVDGYTTYLTNYILIENLFFCFSFAQYQSILINLNNIINWNDFLKN